MDIQKCVINKLLIGPQFAKCAAIAAHFREIAELEEIPFLARAIFIIRSINLLNVTRVFYTKV